MLENIPAQTLWLIIAFSLVMIIFAVADLFSYLRNRHQDYKSIIVSTGVLGTFVGIFIGLLDFDTLNIKGSVPILLEGLKMAFITSIEGMFLSIFLSAIQKTQGHGEIENELQLLGKINERLDNLSLLNQIDEKLKNIEVLPSIHEKLTLIDNHTRILFQEVRSVKTEMQNNQQLLLSSLEQNLAHINVSLEKAITTLSEGATKEIIEALENVIQDFNTNLTEQFGDNFKQLNEAVHNMIVWQENYKNTIQALQISFENAVSTISHTSDKIETIAVNYQKIDVTHTKLKNIIQTNENQISNLEKHLQSLYETGEKTKLIVDSIDSFADKIKGSLGNQSETLTQLIEKNNILKQEIEEQLPESLGQLNQALTSLTDKFRDDYNAFLQKVSAIMNSDRL